MAVSAWVRFFRPNVPQRSSWGLSFRGVRNMVGFDRFLFLRLFAVEMIVSEAGVETGRDLIC